MRSLCIPKRQSLACECFALPSGISIAYLLSPISYPLSPISYLLSPISYLLSPIRSTAIKQRAYNDSDLPLIQAAIANWAQQSGDPAYCHPGDLAHRIYSSGDGPVPLGERVRIWEAEGAISGLAICFRFDCAFEVYLRPQDRGGSLEQAMLAEAAAISERLMAAYAPSQPQLVIDVFADDTPRRTCLEALGFSFYRYWDDIAERHLDTLPPARALPAGYQLRHASWDDAEQLAEIRNAAFGGSLTGQMYREQVMGKPGYEPARELIIAAPDQRIAAVCVVWYDPLNRIGLFEPVGTHPDFQRRGLGRAVMLGGLRTMQQAGMQRARIAFNSENTAARALYAGLGFETIATTLGYQRTRLRNDSRRNNV